MVDCYSVRANNDSTWNREIPLERFLVASSANETVYAGFVK